MLLGEIADIIFSFPDKGVKETADWVYPAFLEENNSITGTKTENEIATNPSCKIKVGDIIIKRIQPQFVSGDYNETYTHSGRCKDHFS